MKYIQKNRDMIDSCLILMITGAATGILCTSKMDLNILDKYSSSLISTFVVPDDLTQFFIQQSLTNILLCLFIFFLGFSLLGIPVIQGTVFLKGFQIGFSAALFIVSYEFKGILGIVMTLIPQILFDTIAIIVISIASIQLSGQLISRLNEPSYQTRIFSLISSKMNDFLISVFLVLCSSTVKTTIGLTMIQLFAQL